MSLLWLVPPPTNILGQGPPISGGAAHVALATNCLFDYRNADEINLNASRRHLQIADLNAYEQTVHSEM